MHFVLVLFQIGFEQHAGFLIVINKQDGAGHGEGLIL
jgi:hypothetical protein